MKKEKLFDAITNIRDDILRRADARYESMSIPIWKKRWVRSVAAMLAVAILGGIIFWPDSSPLFTSAYAVTTAEYPKMTNYPQTDLSPAYDKWREDRNEQRRPAGHADGLEEFFTATIQEFLSGANGENKVYSPVNVYLALGMLAELSDGNSRAQIMDLLGYDSLEDLRQQASDIWNANYMNDGKTISILGSSLWLNEDIAFEKDVLNTLADTYYASTYQGEMGSENYNKALRGWLNAHTGDRLSDQVENISMNAETIMALATTIYYQAKWDSRFSSEKSTEAVFHTPSGDITAEFMNKEKMEGTYYWGEHFGAVSLPLENAGSMRIILPDEDVTVEDLLNDEETMAFIQAGGDWEKAKRLFINLSLPKFDVTGETDLTDGLKSLGVTDVFDWTAADFTPMLGEAENDYLPYVNQAQHDVRVAIDEDGVTAVAYTFISTAAGDAPPPDDEIDFIVDRPFLFAITGSDNVPLFTGIVNHP